MATRDLILVRHGVTDWNVAGRLMGWAVVELNARGRAEAEAVAEALREVRLSCVIASPQCRAQETAAVVARPHGLTVRADPGLAEVWVGDRWQGRTWDDLQGEPEILRSLQDALYRCDQIEPAAAVQDRMVQSAERARAEGGQGSVVLVSHGDPIKVLLAHYLGMDLAAFRRIVIHTGSVSVVRFSGNGCRLLALNWKLPGTLLELLA